MMSRGMQNDRGPFLLLAILVLAAAVTTACGKKGPPRLPDVEAPPAVGDLRAAVEGDAIVLRWTSPAGGDDARNPAGYYVYRAAEPVDEAPCEGCPVLFRRVAEVPLNGAASGEDPLVFREPVLPNTRYQFKVAPYDAAWGPSGPDSNIVRLVTE